MVDMWETTGRLVTNKKFRDKLYKKFEPGDYRMDFGRRAIIPETHYAGARSIIEPVVALPTSLMGIGEILYTISIAEDRDLLTAVANAVVQTAKTAGVRIDGRSTLFYVGLGAMIFDPHLLGFFQQGTYPSFSPLEQTDRDDLTALAVDPLQSAAHNFCDKCWDCSCNCYTTFWDGHTHPVANPAQSPDPPTMRPGA